jgi:hypothetical protein
MAKVKKKTKTTKFILTFLHPPEKSVTFAAAFTAGVLAQPP